MQVRFGLVYAILCTNSRIRPVSTASRNCSRFLAGEQAAVANHHSILRHVMTTFGGRLVGRHIEYITN
jgi:hypothetical protein